MSDKYIKGLFVKKPHEKAPQFIKAKLSLKRDDVIRDLQSRDDEWINLDVKESQKGDFYAEIDTWKPNNTNAKENTEKRSEGQIEGNNDESQEYPEDEINPSDIPF